VVKKVVLSLLCSSLLFGETLMESVQSLMDPSTYNAHKKLIALLFEEEEAFHKGSHFDRVKIASVLEENGLLDLMLPTAKEIELTFEYGGENPLFFMKMMSDMLRNMGLSFVLTKRAVLDKNGFVWTVIFESKMVPDPVLIAKRLAKHQIEIAELERLEATRWRYRVDMSNARIDAKVIEAGSVEKIVRPVRPVWIDVSQIKRLIIRELPGSHWYADVVVYDKMLHILSMKQNDTRTRYLNLKLPPDAVYVKISDRFTLENLRSGLKLTAKGER